MNQPCAAAGREGGYVEPGVEAGTGTGAGAGAGVGVTISPQRYLHGPELSLEDLCDRWTAHSKTCRHCRKAMEISIAWLNRSKHVPLFFSLGILLATFYRRFGMLLISSLFALGGVWGNQWLQR